MRKQVEINKRLLTVFLAALGFRLFWYLAAALLQTFQITEGFLSMDSYLNSWCRWDANHYLNIAQNGYKGALEFCDTCKTALLEKGVSAEVMKNGQHLFLVFFPLYPWLLKIFGFFFTDLRLIAMAVSSLSYGVGCVYMYRLVSIDHSEEIARNSVILLSLFPFGFFFGGIMTEGVFLLLSAATLYYVRVHKWWKGIMFGALASLCRMQGVLLVLPAGIELLVFYQPWKLIKIKDFRKLWEMVYKGFSLMLMFTGTGIYLLVNYLVEGYPFSFMVYQKSHWSQGLGIPTETLTYVFRNAFSDAYNLQMRMVLWMPQAVLAVFSVVLLAAGVKKIRGAYLGYGIAYFLLTYSATWLLSAGRYLSCCIPLFVILAAITEKRKWILQGTMLLFVVLQVLYMNGYFNGLQIM